jgi:hypothetical protein
MTAPEEKSLDGGVLSQLDVDLGSGLIALPFDSIRHLQIDASRGTAQQRLSYDVVQS